MNYAGFYINLDRSTGRYAEMEVQLARLDLGERYKRFPAAEGNSLNLPNPKIQPGEVGCFLSHYLFLKENLHQTVPLHIIEDDVLLSRFTAPVIQSLIDNKSFDTYDIVHLDTFVLTSPVLYKQYRQLYRQAVKRAANGNVEEANFQLIDMQAMEFASTASMVIAPRSIKKLHDIYKEELDKGPETQIDLLIRRKAKEGVLRVGCIFPFATSLRLQQVRTATVNDKTECISALATVIARHAFYVEADWNKCLEYAKQYLAMPEDDIQMKVLAHILGFSLDDRFAFM